MDDATLISIMHFCSSRGSLFEITPRAKELMDQELRRPDKRNLEPHAAGQHERNEARLLKLLR